MVPVAWLAGGWGWVIPGTTMEVGETRGPAKMTSAIASAGNLEVKAPYVQGAFASFCEIPLTTQHKFLILSSGFIDSNEALGRFLLP